MHWRTGNEIQQGLEQAFNAILADRMQDVPLLNSALSVQALPFRGAGDDWLGVLVTPWSMNLMVFPGPNSAWQQLPLGAKFSRELPYGSFEFTLAAEPALGRYGQCSLFSPMLEFADQAAAIAAAEAALNRVLAVPAPRNVSRRDLLRGNLRGT
ncbi:[NiFe]-hydrogenase assembly chaperone HybE [Methylomonas sp. EFPC3]|uniref:[NiFe]-hydrogenase assembly chaperone HybE n=1 Tax=Methylomonas sp. EFPC3 TaxID=3021710 RepID=UPI00241782BB|nr:[NiFe]-hydrogenase assembly chaperone HybE [Methylomonas sp. EFPC3]WFP49855.1 [NiFe]-hydrogenase assembly chaperone HybE [Methylomonas sp. EFPC3]